MKKSLLFSVAGIAALALAGQVSAATINWGQAQNITNASDVSNVGTTVDAYVLFNPGTTIGPINGVTFNSTSSVISINTGYWGYNDALLGSNTTGDANYDSLLSKGGWDWRGEDKVMTLSNLTVGQNYLVQVWVSDARQWGAGRAVLFDGVAVADQQGAAGTLGQYAIGTFTADAATQTINMVRQGEHDLNAVQLRAVPEPASIIAMLSGLVGLAGFGVRRKK